jgi:hypothetical protein
MENIDISAINEVLLTLKDGGMTYVIIALILYIIFRGVNFLFIILKDKLHITGIQSTLNKKNHDIAMEYRDTISIGIQTLLNSTLMTLGGNRMLIFEFTNTLQNVSELPFKSIMCSYETRSPTISPVANNFGMIPLTLYPFLLTELKHNSYRVINNNILTPLSFQDGSDLVARVGDKFALYHIIRSLTGLSIGFVMFTKESEIVESDIVGIANVANRLGSALESVKVKGGI